MYDRWFAKNTHSLQGKRVAVVGATGGIGIPLCHHLARLGAELILLGRSESKLQSLSTALETAHPHLAVSYRLLDLEDMASVDGTADWLAEHPPHVLIHNGGAYAIPRHMTTLGVDNVFQINCLAPYRLTQRLLKPMSRVGGRVVAVGSIAHNYSRIDPADPDFATRTAASKAYGNAKRHLMLALYRRFEGEDRVTLSVVHPGITFTGITDHYPKWLFAVIKHPMKMIFMPPRRAALSVLRGVFDSTATGEWIGPWLFDVWGLPRKRKLRTFTPAEREQAFSAVEKMMACISNENVL